MSLALQIIGWWFLISLTFGPVSGVVVFLGRER